MVLEKFSVLYAVYRHKRKKYLGGRLIQKKILIMHIRSDPCTYLFPQCIASVRHMSKPGLVSAALHLQWSAGRSKSSCMHSLSHRLIIISVKIQMNHLLPFLKRKVNQIFCMHPQLWPLLALDHITPRSILIISCSWHLDHPGTGSPACWCNTVSISWTLEYFVPFYSDRSSEFSSIFLG